MPDCRLVFGTELGVMEVKGDDEKTVDQTIQRLQILEQAIVSESFLIATLHTFAYALRHFGIHYPRCAMPMTGIYSLLVFSFVSRPWDLARPYIKHPPRSLALIHKFHSSPRPWALWSWSRGILKILRHPYPD